MKRPEDYLMDENIRCLTCDNRKWAIRLNMLSRGKWQSLIRRALPDSAFWSLRPRALFIGAAYEVLQTSLGLFANARRPRTLAQIEFGINPSTRIPRKFSAVKKIGRNGLSVSKSRSTSANSSNIM